MKKIGFLLITIILVLGTMGVGYSMWSQTIGVSGSVNTWKTVVGIRDGFSNDTGTTHDPRVNLPLTNPPTFYTSGTNVASTSVNHTRASVVFTGDDAQPNTNPPLNNNGRPYYNLANVVITNAYSGYAPQFVVVIANGGTIPIRVNSVVLTPAAPYFDTNSLLSNNSITWYWSYFLTTGPSGSTPPTTGQGSLIELNAKLNTIQIEPTHQLYLSLTAMFLSSTPAGSNLSFSINVSARAWYKAS